MIDRVKSSKPGGPVNDRPAGKRVKTGPSPRTKAEKRAAAKAAKARARAARKRREVLRLAGTAAAVLLVVVGAVLLINQADDDTQADSGAASSAPSSGGLAPSSPASAPSNTVFPPLPDGADPALRTKPTPLAGTGTLSKLAVTTVVEGKGAAVQAGQTIDVNYVGATYLDGKEFDSSWSRSQAYSFQVGAGRVIPGWDQGLVGVKVGSRVQLDIPAELAYGTNPSNGSPAGALRFIVDVLAAG